MKYPGHRAYIHDGITLTPKLQQRTRAFFWIGLLYIYPASEGGIWGWGRHVQGVQHGAGEQDTCCFGLFEKSVL